MRRKIQFLAILMVLYCGAAIGQVLQPATWNAKFSKSTVQKGDTLEVVFTASLDKGWHLYSNDFDPDLGPVPISFEFKANSSFELVGKVKPLNSHKHYDEIWGGEVSYFEDKAEMRQLLVVKSLPLKVAGSYEFQSCSDESGQCVLGDEEFDLSIKGAVKAISKGDVSTAKVDNTDGEKREMTLWSLFFLAFLGGLAALLTPCVFPMIPMTVSFFMHSNENKTKAKMQAMVYGFSIIAIYTIIGTIVAVTLGANFANFLSTHWLPNILFFIIFMVFAASFFGMFEITMPSGLVNKSVANEDRGGVAGAFFMAFTLVLVSFSCTGPIVGAILVASAGGEVLMPIIGMLGFSLAFALPFTLFAIFPSWLNGLPKSGGWLNSVKVVLGFVELALGLKFLSIADQTYHWGLLDREIYLAIWIVVFTMLGFYLLGKLKFSHDSDVKFVSVPRLILSIITFGFVVYMIPGMFGAPLKALSGYLPPQASQDFDINAIVRANAGSGSVQMDDHKAKYSEFLHLPHGLNGYFDYEEGMAAAKKYNKPVFMDFTGHGCVNCREMEASVWSDTRVLKRLREDFIVIAMYVDDKTELPESEWITSTYDGKVKKTLGKKNSDFQISKYNVNAQPYYVLLDDNGKELVDPRAYDLDVDAFVKFLDRAKDNFNSKGQTASAHQ